MAPPHILQHKMAEGYDSLVTHLGGGFHSGGIEMPAILPRLVALPGGTFVQGVGNWVAGWVAPYTLLAWVLGLLIIMYFLWWMARVVGLRDGMSNPSRYLTSGAYAGNFSARTDGQGGTRESEYQLAMHDSGIEGLDLRERTALELRGASGFMNGRETPYFSDATNSTMMREDRMNAAVQELAKINQERARRGTGADAAPIPWNTFWPDYVRAHHLDTDFGDEGFTFRMQKL